MPVDSDGWCWSPLHLISHLKVKSILALIRFHGVILHGFGTNDKGKKINQQFGCEMESTATQNLAVTQLKKT